MLVPTQNDIVDYLSRI